MLDDVSSRGSSTRSAGFGCRTTAMPPRRRSSRTSGCAAGGPVAARGPVRARTTRERTVSSTSTRCTPGRGDGPVQQRQPVRAGMEVRPSAATSIRLPVRAVVVRGAGLDGGDVPAVRHDVGRSGPPQPARPATVSSSSQSVVPPGRTVVYSTPSSELPQTAREGTGRDRHRRLVGTAGSSMKSAGSAMAYRLRSTDRSRMNNLLSVDVRDPEQLGRATNATVSSRSISCWVPTRWRRSATRSWRRSSRTTWPSGPRRSHGRRRAGPVPAVHAATPAHGTGGRAIARRLLTIPACSTSSPRWSARRSARSRCSTSSRRGPRAGPAPGQHFLRAHPGDLHRGVDRDRRLRRRTAGSRSSRARTPRRWSAPNEADPTESFTRDLPSPERPERGADRNAGRATSCSSTAASSTVAAEHHRRTASAASLIFHYVPRDSVEIARFYNPLVAPDGTDVRIADATGGGPCGEGWTTGEARG